METPDINIASILQDCQKGAPLYSTPFGVVYFQGILSDDTILTCDENNRKWTFYPNGSYIHNRKECVLFPSHDQRNWSRFEPPVLPPFEVKKISVGETFFYVNAVGEVVEETALRMDPNGVLEIGWLFGNQFNTREQAEYAAKKVKELLLSFRKEEEK